jgi:exosortase A
MSSGTSSAFREASPLPNLTARTTLAATLLLAAILLGMAPGARHLAGVWASSPIYHHGALVPLISAFLVWIGWRRGDAPTGCAPPLLGVAAAVLTYALGTRLDAQLLQHLGVVLALACGAAAILGRALTTRHRFALGFLLLAVPFGEGLVPLLQEVTASGTVLIAEAFGLPVLRDGLTLRTPAGDFLVEKECAGLRFLVATFAVGVLCAHLFFTSPRKQALMVLAAVILPVAANVVRASATVLVASATDMRVAAGFDHVVYGWGFFAVVVALVISAAVKLAEPGAPRLPEAPQDAAAPRPLLFGGAAALLCLLPLAA